MARTTVADVQLIFQTSVTITDPQIQAFIDDASLWIDNNLVDGCPDLSDADLIVVEKYLAAYFLSARDPRLRSAVFGDVAETYQNNPQINDYLRIAMSLDPCGIIATNFASTPKRGVKFRVGDGFAVDLDND